MVLNSEERSEKRRKAGRRKIQKFGNLYGREKEVRAELET